MKILLLALTLFLLPFVSVIGQSLDTIPDTAAAVQADTTLAASDADAFEGTDDFSPGLAFFALIGIGLILVCTGVGIALTILCLMVLFGLVSFGILSTSIIVGINKKSFAKGFRTFLVLSSGVGGLILCGAGFYLLNKIQHWWSAKMAILIGASAGLLAGIAFGFLSFIILQRLTTYFRKQLNLL